MKCVCPQCGRRTNIEGEVGDFPTRCQKCHGLLRPPAPGSEEDGALPVGRRVYAEEVTVVKRAPVGVLSGVLTTRPAVGEKKSVLEPESRKELERVKARQAALRRATLRGEYQAIGALSKLGFFAIAAIFTGVILLGARSLWSQSQGKGDGVKVVGKTK